MNFSDSMSAILFQISSLSELAIFLSKVTLLLAVAWVLYFALTRANPRWRVHLWRGATFGLVVLSVWSIGLPRYDVQISGLSSAADTKLSAMASTLLSVGNRSASHPKDPRLPTEATVSAGMSTTILQELPGESPSPRSGFAAWMNSYSWRSIATVVWGLGVLLLALRLGLGRLQISRIVKTSRVTPEHVLATARRVSAELGCGSIEDVRCSAQCTVPFLIGIHRPVIILPDRMCELTFQKNLRAVLAHELSHVRSWDVAWNLSTHLSSILLWFHPLTWRIGAAHRAACDEVCDSVSASLLSDVQAYSSVLANVALDAHTFSRSSALAMAQKCDVRRRIVNLRRNVTKLPLSRRVVGAMVLVGLFSISLLAGVRLMAADVEVADSPKLRPMRIRVLQPDGNPVVNAGITVRAMTDVPVEVVRYRTDDEGVAVVKVPDRNLTSLQLLIWAKRRVTVGASWRGKVIEPSIPAEFTVVMEPGTSIGGIIRDEQGQPISGATVTVDGRKQSGDGVLWYSIRDSPITDKSGRWQSHKIPADLTGFDLNIKSQHPKFAALPAVGYKTLSLDKLRDHSEVLVMHAGLAIEGTVTDPQGRPVAGAMVGRYVKHQVDTVRATTDENGRYRLSPCDAGEYVLAVVADGFAPNSRSVTLTADERSFDLQLQHGESIRLRIADQDGEPIAGATISTALDREIQFLDNTRGALPGNDRNLTADAEGRWSRLWIADDYLDFYIGKSGYETVRKSFKPDEQEQIVTLRVGNWRVSGRVVDRQTKAPITKFNVVEGDTNGIEENVRSWRESTSVENQEGKYHASWDTSGDSRRAIRIEAEGYLPSQAQLLNSAEMEVEHNFELDRGDTVAGVVVTEDGKPLANADVTLCTPARGIYLKNSEPLRGQNSLIVRTGADGRFSFAAPGESFALIVTHERGFARAEGGTDTEEIVLQPWARVEGTLRIRNAPAPNESLTLQYDEPPRNSNTPRVYYDFQTTSDEQGHFVFEKVVPGGGKVYRNVVVEMGRGMSQRIPTHVTKATFNAGETTNVDLSRTGRPVVGKLMMPDGRSDYDWRLAMASLQDLNSPKIMPPVIPFPIGIDPQLDREAALKWYETWKNTEEGAQYAIHVQQYQAMVRSMRPISFGTNVEADGGFSFDDLPAGNYRLSISARAMPKGAPHHPGQSVAHLSHAFEIPEMPDGDSEEPLDLGTLTLEAIQSPAAPEKVVLPK